MKFLLNLVTLFLLLNNGFATTKSLIQNSCKKAASKDPKFKYDFCVKTLEENSESKSAKSLEELVLASAKNAVSKMTNMKRLAEKTLKANKNDQLENPLRECIELYADATDSLNQSLDTVKSRDYKTSTMLIGVGVDAPGNCEYMFSTRFPALKSPLTKENEVLAQIVMIPLAFTNMLR